MEFRILGPLEVSDGDVEVSLGGPKPRALLAVLLLHANEVVAADRLIDELWGEDSPERAAGALRVNVSRLRKALPPDVLTTRAPGYLVRVEPERARSPSLRAARGRGAEPARTRPGGRRSGAAARRAVAVARPGARGLRLRELRPGRPSPGSRRSGWRRSSCGSTPTSRSAATTSWSGSSRRSSPSTRSASACGRSLMTALYRSGRQAEALDAYQDARRTLVDELGHRAEPGAPGAGAGDPSAGPVARTSRRRPPPAGRGRRASGRSSSRSPTRRASTRCSRWPSRSCGVRRASWSWPGSSPDAAELRRRVRLARRAPVCARSARRRGPRGLVHVDGAGRRAGSARRPSSTSSCCSPTLPTSSWPTEFPTRSSPPLLAETPCDVALLVPRDATPDGRRAGALRRGGARLGGGRARRLARARRPARRSGSPAPPPCRSRAGATRAGCSRTARSPSSGSSASRPSRC